VEVDSRTLDTRRLDADVCIVGAGPAGLTLARALIPHGPRVVLLESGGRSADPEAQALGDGPTTGDPYAGPGATRHRQAGGASQVWNTWLGSAMGARYVPLDALDFEARDWLPLSGWPFDKATLDPYYAQAQEVCGLGPYRYDPEPWETGDRRPLPLLAGPLTTAVYQYGPARLFTDAYLGEIRRAAGALLCLHATATGFETDPAARSITALRAARVTGRPLDVRARLFVLAAGGIENARLLLLPTAARPGGLGGESGLAGRCFMEHPRDMACRLVPAGAWLWDRCGFYDIHQAAAGLVRGRLTFTEEARRGQQLPGMSITLQPRPRPLRWPAAETLRTRVLGPRRRHDAHWFHRPGQARRFDALHLRINVEQAPDPDNRVFLDTERDRFGLPRAAIHWRWRDRDDRDLARVRAIVAAELERAGLGRVVIEPGVPPDPNAHHHMGTTRMHPDPHRGVATADGRVHGLSNLFVAGSSLFPTGGFANPTLTIVALALRLADHLKTQL
jgi:choline dehydrogenase-like flavoprotein